jgi:transposase
LCAKFTLQTFRGKLLLHEKGRKLLQGSVKVCRTAGVLRSRKIRAAMDTSPIIGRGAVKDTYNLVADGMVKLLRALAALETPLLEPVDVKGYAGRHDFSRYFADMSLKGGAELDWDSQTERDAFLTGLVVDVRRALTLARSLLESAESFIGPRCGSANDVRDAMGLLEQLVDQDIEVGGDGQAQLKQGVAKDRVVSVYDPEMRHGRKSKRVRFDGHKGEIVADSDSGVIVDVSVKPGNAHDA